MHLCHVSSKALYIYQETTLVIFKCYGHCDSLVRRNVSECVTCPKILVKMYVKVGCYIMALMTLLNTEIYLSEMVSLFVVVFLLLFLAFDFCRFCVVIRLFHPRHNGQWPPTSKDFLSQILSITFIFLERASIFPFPLSVLNKGTTGTIFMTSLVWRGPWLGIEPGTFRTRSQHFTTRLSRRWW